MSMTYFNFSYPLDTFQIIGAEVIKNNENLLVTAHTGSGKTALALEAIAKTLSEKKKVVYTSPIKALSNQKYAEFAELFPSIGIMTGDIKINPLGDLLIMTAEILRNSLLKKEENINYEWNFNPNEVGCVILDEVHSINIPDRGKVWEEIILNLNKKIQLVMLSATISDSEKFAEWVSKLKNVKCHLVSTLKRPVPLQHGIWDPIDQNINYFLIGDKNWKKNIWASLQKKINNYYLNNSFSLNQFFNCVKYLFDNNMTPANIFLLNRDLCYKYAEKLPFVFTTTEETCIINNIWDNKLHKYKKIYEKSDEWNNLYKIVGKGIGIHHSGMIPILKEIVEILYSEGLIKILIATETFAMGVNMPTKSVVFCNIYKFDGIKSNRIFKPEEYGQMAGRAGRRGKDIIGNVIILPFKNLIDEEKAIKMILSPPQKLLSKFSIDPIFILKQIGNAVNITEISSTLNELCFNSLFHYQEYNEDYYNLLKNKVSLLNINKNDLNIYYEIQEINDKFINFKLNYKQKQKLNDDKNKLSESINISLIETYIKINNEISQLEYTKDKINIQIKLIINFLEKYNYLLINNDEIKLTKYGKILSEINECNPFILGFIIFSDLFDTLDFSEICAICSILINENKDEDLYMSDLNCSNNCKSLLNSIEKEIEIFLNIESKFNNDLPYPYKLNWTINYATFNQVKDWINMSNSSNVSLATGNFIKTILRLNNILKNLEIIFKLFDKINLLNKLDCYQEKLIKDIVISDSLYL